MAGKSRSQIGRMSKLKGKTREREFAQYLEEKGLRARRTAQFCGKAGDSDVVCEDLPRIFIEVKSEEQLNLWDAGSTALSDSKKEGKIPMVTYRKNQRPYWIVMMHVDDWLKLAQAHALVQRDSYGNVVNEPLKYEDKTGTGS